MEGTLKLKSGAQASFENGDFTGKQFDEEGKVGLNWDTNDMPAAGEDSLTVKYTDIVGNSTEAQFAVKMASGLPIVADDTGLNPGKARLERLDTDGGVIETVYITVSGTAGEWVTLRVGDITRTERLPISGEYNIQAISDFTFEFEANSFPSDQAITYSVTYDDISSAEATNMFVYDPLADDIILLTGPLVADEFPVICGLMEQNSYIVVLHNGEAVKNTANHRYVSFDQFGLFTVEFPFPLQEGDDVVIQARDAANNINMNRRFKVGAPVYEMQAKAYAMGRTFKVRNKDAKEGEDPYEWLMAAKLTREELEAGVTLHMVAAGAFDVGTIDLKLVNNELVVSPMLEDVNIVIQAGYLPDLKAMLEGGIHTTVNPEDTVFWVMVEQDVVLSSEQASESFQLDDSEGNLVRQEYVDRQNEKPYAK